ncbi:ABC transporter ATP-binding protein/permease [Rhodococcus sp. NPDC059969]|uniref:ABC transporter ATP-binding protein/permease n=1 Tax=Rhodococcus sp. NPDC059969 TaxID=3347018 RepID=UPI003670D5CC
MNWNNAVPDSAVWLAEAFAITVVALVIAGLLLGRYTRWGNQFRRMAWPYFDPQRTVLPLLILASLLLLTIFGVRVTVLFSYWYKDFYDAIQNLDETAFWHYLRVFAILAAVHVVSSLVVYLVGQTLDISWRSWLNDTLTDDWLDGRAYYRGNFLENPVDNPDQRIQADITAFVTSSRTLSMGAVAAMVSIVSFTKILWDLSGPLTVFGAEIPRAMIFLVYIYVLVTTALAFWIGRPLIMLNFLNEKFGATFRYALVRLREYGESIAFYRGENVERRTLGLRFAAVIRNMWAIVFRTLKFSGFNLAVDQTAVVFPFLVQGSRLFSGQITFGDVMQTAQAFGQVHNSLSFFRESYADFASFRATLIRLTGLADANRRARALPVLDAFSSGSHLVVRGLDVRTPGGEALISELDLSLGPGDALLVKGPSGSGKTTLLRSIAQLWPYTNGSVTTPVGDVLFLSQRPYLPLGSLRAGLAYPDQLPSGQPNTGRSSFDDRRLHDALAEVHLAHLIGRLDEAADWTRILSPGEQQRLAFARVLLIRPRTAFLDEATSGIDEGLEYTLYDILRRELPDSIIVSVGHRSTLDVFHNRQLELRGAGHWTLTDHEG